MKILYITENLGRGGAETMLTNLLPLMSVHGAECHIAALYPPYDLTDTFRKNGIKVHQLNISHPWNVLQALLYLSRLLQKEQFDIVHAHLFHAALPVALLRIFSIATCSVVTFHNRGYDAYPPKGLVKQLRRWIDGWITRHGFDAYIAVSNAVSDSARRHLHIEKVAVIGNGIDLNAIEIASRSVKNRVRQKFDLPVDCPIVVFPGRLVWEKDHKTFLKAWSIVHQDRPDAFGLIVGHGPLQSELELIIAASDFAGSIRLISGMDQYGLFELIHACDVVTIPSISEGWGMIVAESMALGKPIVCTLAGGIPEVLGDLSTAITFPIGDFTALASSILDLLNNDKHRIELGQRAKRRAISNLSIEAVAVSHLTLYQSLVENKVFV